MKLSIHEINKGIYISAREKVLKELQKEGFNVTLDYLVGIDRNVRLDLYAQNDKERRIYEFRVGKNKIPKEQFVFLQEQAKLLQARLFIIYLEVPTSKRINFANIEHIIGKDIAANPPKELLNIAPKTKILSIDSLDINDILIEGDIITLRGQGILFIEAQYGSEMQVARDMGRFEEMDFDFWFRLKYNIYKQKVTYAYYKIDTSWYYE